TNLRQFYRRAGVDDRIGWFDTLSFIGRDGSLSALRSSRLPAPFHLLPSFFRARFLSSADQQALARVLVRMPARDDPDAEKTTKLDGLRQQRQTPAAIERFWRVILVSALNEELERCSAAYARQIFRTGFLSHRRAYEMGIPAVPLRELYEPCVARIREQG